MRFLIVFLISIVGFLSPWSSSGIYAGGTSASCHLTPRDFNAQGCKALNEGYYFQQSSQSCKRFNWGGCGIPEPFEEEGACLASCASVGGWNDKAPGQSKAVNVCSYNGIKQAKGINTVALHSWWSPSREDNRATTRANWRKSQNSQIEGYSQYRVEGKVFTHPRPQGTIRLNEWYSPERGDYFSTSQHQREGEIKKSLSPDYRHVRHEGYICPPSSNPGPAFVPVFSWYNWERGDNFLTTQPQWSMSFKQIQWKSGDRNSGHNIKNGPTQDGYHLFRLEGYILK